MRKSMSSSHIKGFFLIETLIALLVLVFMLLGLSYLMLSTIDTNMQARRITAAIELAQARLEEIRGIPYAGLTAGSDSAALGTGSSYARTWTVTDGHPTADTKTVTVTVSWNDKLGYHQVQLPTLVAAE